MSHEHPRPKCANGRRRQLGGMCGSRLIELRSLLVGHRSTAHFEQRYNLDGSLYTTKMQMTPKPSEKQASKQMIQTLLGWGGAQIPEGAGSWKGRSGSLYTATALLRVGDGLELSCVSLGYEKGWCWVTT